MTIRNLSGRGWAYTGAALGGAVSIAANVAHSFIPPSDAPASWSPEPGAVVGAIVWPVFLFVAVEILARVAWPHGLTWQALRWAGMLPVAAVAALVSYRHLSGLLAFYGEEPIVCVLGPLAVDGLMVMATGALLATAPHQHMSTSVVPDSVQDTPTPPPPATPVTVTTEPVVPQPDPAATPEPAVADRSAIVPTPAEIAARVAPSPTSLPLRPTATRPATARTSKPKPSRPKPTTPAVPLAAPAADTPVTAPEPAQLTLPTVVDPDLLAKARETATQYRTEHGAPITANQLAARLRVNSELATQALAVIDLGPTNPTQKIPTANGRPVKATR